MKKIDRQNMFLIACLVAALLVSLFVIVRKEEETKAVFLSYLNMQEILESEEEDYRANVSVVIENAQQQDLNTLIIHVRAFGDAYYNSEVYPQAQVMNHLGIDYDPLAIFVELAHESGLDVIAWINPYRISYTQSQYEYFLENTALSEDEILKVDTKAIIDPASDAGRKLIVAGIEEVLAYGVDGILFDDYFYMDTMLEETTEQQRWAYVNTLIAEVYDTIKSYDNHVTFGISPSGNLEYAKLIGADIETWISEAGYVDYLMPQLYWTDHYGDDETTLFTNRLEAYDELKTEANSDVELMAALAIYLCGTSNDYDSGWANYDDNIATQIETLEAYGWSGYAYYDYAGMISEAAQTELSHVN